VGSHVLFLKLLGFGIATAADANGVFYFDQSTPTPAIVLSVQDCDASESTPAHRRAFAGGFMFAIKCASNNENFVETLIFGERVDGTGAVLIEFPLPEHRGGGTQDTISNIRWYPDTKEIGEIFSIAKSRSGSIPRYAGLRVAGSWTDCRQSQSLSGGANAGINRQIGSRIVAGVQIEGSLGTGADFDDTGPTGRTFAGPFRPHVCIHAGWSRP
jgi:hypothetical protein